MKFRRFLCYILMLLITTLAQAQSRGNSGIKLCNEVHSFLKKNGFSPASQSLIVSGENTFPYNIIVNFNSEQNSSPENLILVFFQEDIPDNQTLIRETLQNIMEKKYPFQITVLFAYGEKQKLEKADMIYGTDVFLEGLNTNLSYTAVIFDLEGRENIIESTSNGLSSPPQLIKNSMNLYRANGLGNNLPRIVLSQLSSYKFISNRILGAFFDYEIPAIQLSLGGVSPENKISSAGKIISGFVDLYSQDAEENWEHHFLIVKFLGSYRIVSERMILRIICPTIFMWILFIFMLIFVNRRLKKHTWYTIGKIWWSVPLTWLLLILGFTLAGIFYKNIFINATDAGKIYGQLILQIIVSLFLTLSSYLLILTFNYDFGERAVDYLLVISCFINQSVFILIDISLSPIFIIICLLSLLALSVKNNSLHIAVFLLMILPLIPYGHRIISSAELSSLAAFLSSSRTINFVIPLVLYPVYIVLFRIITSIRSQKKKSRYVVTASIVTFVTISLALICTGLIRTSKLNKNQHISPELSVSPLGNELISLSISDEIVFDDIIRTIHLSLKEDCLLCDLLISTNQTNPILYSDNDYINLAANTARFRIPNNPPQEMIFSYGAAKTPCKITASAVIEGEKEGDYQFISRSLEIGEK